MWLLAVEEFVTASKQDIQQGYGGLVFMGLFFLALICVGVWWLKRSC